MDVHNIYIFIYAGTFNHLIPIVDVGKRGTH